MSVAGRFPAGRRARWPLSVVVIALLAAMLVPMAAPDAVGGVDLAQADHLVVSEVVTGGASASDELIELHNPTLAPLPLEGLEVVYVTATGATISRRATWALGAPSVPAGGHVLIANEAGIFASIADATYASGMAATGGSVAIRILGASTAIDAAGWGTAANAWLEGAAAPAPAAGASIERLPGGALGSGHDTDDNASDFVERLIPEPQNLASPPTPDPAATPSPEPTPAPPTSTPVATATPPPGPAVTAIADVRGAPDGTTATIEAVALTRSDFHDGGGFVADATAGIAIILPDGAFAPGDRLRVTGDVDDRFSQRTLRADAGALTILGTASQPDPIAIPTGAVNEAVEGGLVRIHGSILGSPTTLTSGLAFDVDDGSGATRVVVATATGIDTATWRSGVTVDLVGVAGQRDSTGSGTDGYRVMPRSPADVIGVGGPGPSPSPSPGEEGITSIADARGAERNARLRIRGVVTLPSGLVDERTAVVQDATGAILLRLTEKSGRLALGTRVEVGGARSTLGGMESLRVTDSIVSLGDAAAPAAREIRTGEVSDADEAVLVVARGAIVASARRFSSGLVSFEIDDGSGPLRVSLAARLEAGRDGLTGGTWVEVRGVLGQETTQSRPDEGYRIWPRTVSEVRVTAPASSETGGASSTAGGAASESGGPSGSLGDVDAVNLAQLRIGATLVVGPWPELGIGGLLWDGTSLVAVHASSGRAVERLTRSGPPPISVALGGLQAAGSEPVTGVPLVRLGDAADATIPIDTLPAAPSRGLDGDLPAWASVVGSLVGPAGRRSLVVDGERIALDDRCDEVGALDRRGMVSVTGVALDAPRRLLVPCAGVRPAPRVAVVTTDAAAPADNEAVPVPAGTRVTDDVRRPVMAGLLFLAAVSLGIGAIVARRRDAGDAAGPPEAGDDSSTPGARLTLVQAPQEGGP